MNTGFVSKSEISEFLETVQQADSVVVHENSTIEQESNVVSFEMITKSDNDPGKLAVIKGGRAGEMKKDSYFFCKHYLFVRLVNCSIKMVL